MHTIYRYLQFFVLILLTFLPPLQILAQKLPSPEAPTTLESDQLILHLNGGTVVSAPNYEAGSVPPGIGIPHALINSLPEADYYAVVFFDGLAGCPSDNYVINSFRANAYWGYDIRGAGAPFAKAASTAAGGCMQEFHLDPRKEGDWLWGAISTTGTSSAIADANGIPAFAICATALACNPLAPDTLIVSPSTPQTISNVLFLPGMKGSKLYKDNPLCLLPSETCALPLWLPIADTFASGLFLDTDGRSKSEIFTLENGLLGSVLGKSFYDSFMSKLDSAKEQHLFGSNWEWKAISYDWRLSLPDVIHNGTKHGGRIYYGEPTDTPYIEKELRSLASSSPTGKVTIVAHSNGGLVAKALMASLGDTLAAQLIDTVIFVGVPQTGAPRALGALLYGDAEGIPGIRNVPNFILSSAHAREFGLHSPLAYHLLPSASYLAIQQPSQPLVRFGDGQLLAKEHAAYGKSIDTSQELRSFALALEEGRSMPAPSDLLSANILSANLLSYAESEHELLDSWQPPEGVEVYQLAGYDTPTISGIDLYETPHRSEPPSLLYRPLFSQNGDGTVPVISSLFIKASDHVHQIWLDLVGMRNSTLSYSHANILEASDVQETILNILTGARPFPSRAHAMEAAPPPNKNGQYALYVHSPVSLTVSTNDGRETSVSEEASKEEIPGSTSGVFGEVKYVLVPVTQSPYTVRLVGIRSGSFTLDVQELVGDEIVASSTIADVPVEQNTQATFTLGKSLDETSPLLVDTNEDGSTDIAIPFVLRSTVFVEEKKPLGLERALRKTLQRPPGLEKPTTTISRAAPAEMLISMRPPVRLTRARPVSGTTTTTRPEFSVTEFAETVHPSRFERLYLLLQKVLHAILSLFKMLVVR